MAATKVRIELKKFNMASIKDNSVVQFLGRRGTGKSYLVRNLCYHQRGIPCGTVISATESSNEFFGKFVPSIFIFDAYSPDILDRFVKRQQMIVKAYNKEIKESGRSTIDPRAICILDDCLYDAHTWTNDTNIKYLFLNGRHIYVLFVLTSQYPLGLPPIFRSNIDYNFLLRESNKSNRRRLHEHYAGVIPTFEMFESILDSCTENNECLVVANSAQSNKIDNILYWYKAPADQPNFRMGAQQFWDIQAQVDAEGGDDEDEKYDPDRDTLLLAKRKNNQPVLNIRKRQY